MLVQHFDIGNILYTGGVSQDRAMNSRPLPIFPNSNHERRQSIASPSGRFATSNAEVGNHLAAAWLFAKPNARLGSHT